MNRRITTALLLLLGSAPAAMAAPRYQVTRTVYGCVDSRATTALSAHAGAAQTGWGLRVRRRGRCFVLKPTQQFEIILHRYELVLLRLVPPHVGEPPLFVLAGDVRQAGQHAPAVIGQPVFTSISPPATKAGAMGTRAYSPPLPTAPPVQAAPMFTSSIAQMPQSGAASAPSASLAPVPSSDLAPLPSPVSASAPDDATATAPPAVASAWPPQSAGSTLHPGRALLTSILVTVLLLAFVGGALLVARRRRHFAHVEDAGWPPNENETIPEPVVIAPKPSAMPTPQDFRKLCATELEVAGWTTQMGFNGGGAGPDILGRRAGGILAVRCRVSRTAITGEMVDEAAAMGSRQESAITALVSNAPFSQRA
ncbi:MAG: hypothetical protein ACRYFY_01005, partial [Janthinobacterium lividum]